MTELDKLLDRVSRAVEPVLWDILDEIDQPAPRRYRATLLVDEDTAHELIRLELEGDRSRGELLTITKHKQGK